MFPYTPDPKTIVVAQEKYPYRNVFPYSTKLQIVYPLYNRKAIIRKQIIMIIVVILLSFRSRIINLAGINPFTKIITKINSITKLQGQQLLFLHQETHVLTLKAAILNQCCVAMVDKVITI